jgi:hypothetical protein
VSLLVDNFSENAPERSRTPPATQRVIVDSSFAAQTRGPVFGAKFVQRKRTSSDVARGLGPNDKPLECHSKSNRQAEDCDFVIHALQKKAEKIARSTTKVEHSIFTIGREVKDREDLRKQRRLTRMSYKHKA